MPQPSAPPCGLTMKVFFLCAAIYRLHASASFYNSKVIGTKLKSCSKCLYILLKILANLALLVATPAPGKRLKIAAVLIIRWLSKERKVLSEKLMNSITKAKISVGSPISMDLLSVSCYGNCHITSACYSLMCTSRQLNFSIRACSRQRSDRAAVVLIESCFPPVGLFIFFLTLVSSAGSIVLLSSSWV